VVVYVVANVVEEAERARSFPIIGLSPEVEAAGGHGLNARDDPVRFR